MPSTHLLNHDRLLVSIVHTVLHHIQVFVMGCRHPEKSSRPSFSSLYQTLNREFASLLEWTDEDSQCHPQASLLGAELDAGKDLYSELQWAYLQQ